MISDYLVMHSSGPCFTLDAIEYKQALELFPGLAFDNIEKSVIGLIDVGYDSYFYDCTILAQFERLFKLIQFKKVLKNHTIEIILDNAKKRAVKAYSLFNFGKFIDIRCPTGTIHYIDQHGEDYGIGFYFQTGPNKGLNKGLIEISKDLNITLRPKLKLDKEIFYLVIEHLK